MNKNPLTFEQMTKKYLAAGALCSLRGAPSCRQDKAAPATVSACYVTGNFYGWQPKGGNS